MGDATSSGVVEVRRAPYCAETRLELQDDLITPVSRFYARNNFPFPAAWPDLTIEGAVERPQTLTLADLLALPSQTLVATMECAGNGRAFMSPAVPGEQWKLGAVSTAEWRGPRLRDVLAGPEVLASTVEVQFSGADGFVRSLPVEVALAAETMLAVGMNGGQLPREHGGPLRVLVPGWYGMSAVKWVTNISALIKPFRGHFQVERYVIDDRPLGEMAVRAVITSPVARAKVGSSFQVRGLAWTGVGVVVAVEVSADGGQSWSQARLLDSPGRFAWVRWESGVSAPVGAALDLLCRAVDSAGRVQPLEPVWNSLGYANNAAVRVPVTVDG